MINSKLKSTLQRQTNTHKTISLKSQISPFLPFQDQLLTNRLKRHRDRDDPFFQDISCDLTSFLHTVRQLQGSVPHPLSVFEHRLRGLRNKTYHLLLRLMLILAQNLPPHHRPQHRSTSFEILGYINVTISGHIF